MFKNRYDKSIAQACYLSVIEEKTMNSVDTFITYITLKKGNVFENLGFAPEEASKLKVKAQQRHQLSERIRDKYPNNKLSH